MAQCTRINFVRGTNSCHCPASLVYCLLPYVYQLLYCILMYINPLLFLLGLHTVSVYNTLSTFSQYILYIALYTLDCVRTFYLQYVYCTVYNTCCPWVHSVQCVRIHVHTVHGTVQYSPDGQLAVTKTTVLSWTRTTKYSPWYCTVYCSRSSQIRTEQYDNSYWT